MSDIHISFFFNILFAAAILWQWLQYRSLEHKTRKHRAAFGSIDARCRAIVKLIAQEWPDLEPLRGDEFVRGLQAKLAEANRTRLNPQ